MSVKKQLVIFSLLMLVSAALLIAGNLYVSRPAAPCIKTGNNPAKCCQDPGGIKPQKPHWHFITQGILHVSA